MSPSTIQLVFFVSILLQISPQHVESARILAYIAIPSYSHQMFYQQLWRELAIKGHDMVVVTSDPTGETLPNLKEISIREAYGPIKALINATIQENMVKLILTSHLAEMMDNILLFEMNLPQIQEMITNKEDHFDLFIAEHMPTIHIAFKHKYKCPLIGVISLDGFYSSHSIMGNPVHSILYPSAMVPVSENMNVFERTLVTVLDTIAWLTMGRASERINNAAKQYFGEDVPSIDELFDETDMLFVNANPLFSSTRPFTPGTINIAGGIHMKKPKPLPEDLLQFLDSATNGAIYFSLGSNVKSKELSIEMREVFINALAALPYKVLWKFEDDTLPGKPENVIITKWAPQQDILRHPNVKLFITQGGIQSLEEALYSHVPLVVIPFLGDQMANAVKVEAKKIGVTLDRHTLTIEKFKAAVFKVVDNKMYRDTIKNLALQIQDEPLSSLERAVWWIEYVIRNKGAQHLKGPRIPNWQYYHVDVIAFLGGLLLVFVGVLVGMLVLVFKGMKKAVTKSKQIVDKKNN